MPVLSEDLTPRLVEAVIGGELTPGTKLSEPELARRFEVGRGSVRESLLRLEGLGLVERLPRQGARVVQLTAEGLTELFAVREALEGMACRLAAAAITREEAEALTRLLDEHQKFVDSQEVYLRQQGEEDFHYLLFKASHNQMLVKLLCDELYQLLRMYRHRLSYRHSDPRLALREHRQILDAVLQGDGELAELLMRRHVARSRNHLLAQFNEEMQ
ncbi:GntR family transcriptional regulator [Zobellella endophytica]|uniref:GntR family transcriptional regulator n=1 Tax=Zobellella endophytica TaxID=2116700 RepID=A0A2P7R657_9GAMM|nr:GntR family transcriptional regulator [Zobellella endophytica]PSJ45701.1 GntR family transcriptional regulator [Zobellella endophytica]